MKKKREKKKMIDLDFTSLAPWASHPLRYELNILTPRASHQILRNSAKFSFNHCLLNKSTEAYL